MEAYSAGKFIEPFQSGYYCCTNDKIYLAGRWNPFLYCLDLAENKTDVIAEIPDELSHGHSLSYVYKNKVFLTAYFSDHIVMYDLQSNKFTKISIDDPEKLKAICSIHNFNDKLYMVSVTGKCIIELDLEENRISYCHEIPFLETDGNIGIESVLHGESIYIPVLTESKIIEFNIINKQFEEHCINCNIGGFRTICYANGYFWLTGTGETIVKVSDKMTEIDYIYIPDDLKIYLYSDNKHNFFKYKGEISDIFKEFSVFYNSYSDGNFVWLIPYNSEDILYVNINTNEINKLHFIEEKTSNNFVEAIGFTNIFIDNKNKILTYSEKNGFFYYIDCNRKNYEIINPVISKEQVEYIYDKINVLYENRAFSIDYMLNKIEKNKFIDYQTAEENNTGYKIYDKIKGEIYYLRKE